MSLVRPDSVRTDGSNPFARHSMGVRVPGIFRETIERNPDYPAPVLDALRRLTEAIENDAPLALFEPPAPDFDRWAALFEPYAGETWLDTEWFFAEALSYRLMMSAVRYWATLRDPFRPFKEEEMTSSVLWDALDAVHGLEGPLESRLEAMLLAALWGNRIDLSIKQAAAQGTAARDDHLLVNHIPRAAERLLRVGPGAVHVFMDNAGTEQAIDYALVDLLLGEGVARTVTLHVKMLPVLVSDVIVPDVYRLFALMHERGGEAAALAGRLEGYLEDGRLRVVPDEFWNTAGRLWELPPRLARPLREARLVVMKGDFNYRRATNDALWPPGGSLAEALPGFPAPLLALRTLKCDTLVGVDAATQVRLDAEEGPSWRTNGTYGVAQLAG